MACYLLTNNSFKRFSVSKTFFLFLSPAFVSVCPIYFDNVYIYIYIYTYMWRYVDMCIYMWRYIDDIFMIQHHGENKLKQFIDKLNKFHPAIKFTCDYSRERVHFLDVQVILENKEISTDLYAKETDSQSVPPSIIVSPISLC